MKVRAGGFYILLVSSVIAAAVAVRAFDPFFVQALRLIAFDSYQRISPQAFDENVPVRVVDIDERFISFSSAGSAWVAERCRSLSGYLRDWSRPAGVAGTGAGT